MTKYLFIKNKKTTNNVFFTRDVGIAAVHRGDGNGIGPGRNTAGGATTTATQARTHAQEDQHHQGHRPSLSTDTRDEK